MDESTDVKRKMTPSLPANYVSILHLRERWIKEKEQKQTEEEEERRRNQHGEEQETKEDDLKKPREDLDEIRLNQSDQKHWGGRNSKKDESIDGGEASLAEEEETAAIGGLPEKKKKRGRRKRYDSKKKKRTNQEVEECGSIKPPEMHNLVKHQIRVYWKKEENAMVNKSFGWREKAVTAIETQFKDLSIKRGQGTKKLKAQMRSLNRNQSNQRHDLPLGIAIETAAMVWVKKGQNERAGDGNGSGVKPLNA